MASPSAPSVSAAASARARILRSSASTFAGTTHRNAPSGNSLFNARAPAASTSSTGIRPPSRAASNASRETPYRNGSGAAAGSAAPVSSPSSPAGTGVSPSAETRRSVCSRNASSATAASNCSFDTKWYRASRSRSLPSSAEACSPSSAGRVVVVVTRANASGNSVVKRSSSAFFPPSAGPHSTSGRTTFAASAASSTGGMISGRLVDTSSHKRARVASREGASCASEITSSASYAPRARPASRSARAAAADDAADASDSVSHRLSLASCSSKVAGPRNRLMGGAPAGATAASFAPQNATNASSASTLGKFTSASFSSLAAFSSDAFVMPYLYVTSAWANCVSQMHAYSPEAASNASSVRCSIAIALQGWPGRPGVVAGEKVVADAPSASFESAASAASASASGSSSLGNFGCLGSVVTIAGNANTSGNSRATLRRQSLFSRKLGPASATGLIFGVSVSFAGITSE